MKKELTTQQENFLELAALHAKTYSEIEEELGIPKKVSSVWWEELKVEREALAEIRKIWKTKFKDNEIDVSVFRKWYETAKKQCYYCDITIEEIIKLWELDSKLTKRNRGKKLEIERRKPNEPYSNIENLVFSCYWCNNAKTDTFSDNEFHIIGKAIKQVWRNRLK